MNRIVAWMGLTAVAIPLVGCVPQEKYNALKLERDRMAGQLGQAQNEASSARAEADTLKAQLAALNANSGDRSAYLTSLTAENTNLKDRLRELNERYEAALGRVGQGTALPEPLTNELKQFADEHSDLVTFDPARGMLKFKSDVTFALGSADLTPKARSVIDRFAAIVNSASASGYELLVAGHTDNVRVSRPATIQAGHKDNWYLSAHRAISVAEEMMKQGVNGTRLGVVGYADKRPAASNATASGREQNRRVEVLILPAQVKTSAPAAVEKQSSQKTAPQMNKDNVNRYNK